MFDRNLRLVLSRHLKREFKLDRTDNLQLISDFLFRIDISMG